MFSRDYNDINTNKTDNLVPAPCRSLDADLKRDGRSLKRAYTWRGMCRCAIGPTSIIIYSSEWLREGKSCVSVLLPLFDIRLIESSRGPERRMCWVCVHVYEREREGGREGGRRDKEWKRDEKRPRSVSPALNLTFLRESEKLPRAFAKAARSHGIAILDAADCRRKRPTTTTLGLSISFYLVLSPRLSYLPTACASVTLLRSPHRIGAMRRVATRILICCATDTFHGHHRDATRRAASSPAGKWAESRKKTTCGSLGHCAKWPGRRSDRT